MAESMTVHFAKKKQKKKPLKWEMSMKLSTSIISTIAMIKFGDVSSLYVSTYALSQYFKRVTFIWNSHSIQFHKKLLKKCKMKTNLKELLQSSAQKQLYYIHINILSKNTHNGKIVVNISFINITDILTILTTTTTIKKTIIHISTDCFFTMCIKKIRYFQNSICIH